MTRQEAEAMLDELVGGGGTEQRVRVRRALERAARYYRKWLVEGETPQARQARAYLDSRGFGTDVLDAYGVGYAPRKEIRTTARKLGVDVEDLASAGLLWERGTERFAGRIVWPIRDTLGRVTGFGGRVLPGEETFVGRDGGQRMRAKYLNSPQGELFDKGSLLFGLAVALPYIRRSRRAVVVEGYTDVLALHQAGIRNVVGSLGTALTEQHLRALSPYADEVVLVFDPDSAGVAAAIKAAELRNTVPTLSAVVLDEDPADYADRRGADELREALGATAPIPVAIARARAGGGAAGASGARAREAWRALEAFAGERLGTTR